MFNKDLVDSLGILLPLIGITFGHENFKLNVSHLGEFDELYNLLKKIDKKLNKVLEVLKINEKEE